MKTLSQVLTELVSEAAEIAGHAGVLEDVQAAGATSNPAFGDYQSNHAFRLGKALRTNPKAVADAVVAALPAHGAVARAEVAGPGFINFTLEDAWLAAQVEAQAADEHLGLVQSGAGRTVVIDYSSPNVAKRMHIGHMRSTIIGNTLDRIHRASGWRVVADNHVGDWGTQFGKLIVAWHEWLDEDAFAEDAIGELERLYVKFGHEVEADASLGDRARSETARLQAGDPENRALWRRFIEVSMKEFDAVYERLGVRFDETLGESAYNDELADVVASLRASGVAEDSEGAVVIKYTADDGKGMGDTVLVVQKKDGAFLYGTTDLATIRHRLRTWAPERVVYVTDTRQQLHFKQVFAGWRRWQPHSRIDLVHTWFGMLKLPEGVMAARKGNVIRLVDLLDEAVRRARVVVDEKSPELPEVERAAIAEAVGVGAVRYADVSQNPQSDVTFDWDRMLALDGNTAPYLLNALVRCRAIQRKGGGADRTVRGVVLGHPAERELALHLLRTPEAVELALSTQRANLLCDHLYNTANALHRFYGACSVLGAESDVLRTSRLALVEATARVLDHGLQLVGIQPLERM